MFSKSHCLEQYGQYYILHTKKPELKIIKARHTLSEFHFQCSITQIIVNNKQRINYIKRKLERHKSSIVKIAFISIAGMITMRS